MSDNPDATVFYGIVPLDDESKEDVADRDWSCPWRMDVECDEQEALDKAMWIAPELNWEIKNEMRRKCPVEFLQTGNDADGYRFVLAIKESVTHAHEWEVTRLTGWTASAPHCNSSEWPKILDEWADKLGIPPWIRGVPGWFAFATGGT